MADSSPLYLGFDLSTQQLKGLAITSDLKVVYSAIYDFDADSHDFGIKAGVLTNDTNHEVYAPVALWLRALDVLLSRLRESGLDFGRVRGISGAGQQHGSVYWSGEGEAKLGRMDGRRTLEEELEGAFAHPFSPNWQDASTQKECEEFDGCLGGEEELARVTGSKAHHRFTGPQILRFTRVHPAAYARTTRISLVSSFLASLFLGKVARIDISDVCGMNLWDIKAASWHEKLIALAASSVSSPADAPHSHSFATISSPTHPSPAQELQQRLGTVHMDPSAPLGKMSPYFCTKYGFSKDCIIAPFTGDNPATILALPLRANDAIVSLGTSTTFLMSTPHYKPDPSTHFFNHPTTKGLYMFMLCYKNGGLARERVRDAINADGGEGTLNENKKGSDEERRDGKWKGDGEGKGDEEGKEGGSREEKRKGASKSWDHFNALALSTPPLGQQNPETDPMKLGLYFPRPEIVPAVRAGTWRFSYSPTTNSLLEYPSPSAASTSASTSSTTPTTNPSSPPPHPHPWLLPASDARAIIESQLLSLRLRSRALVSPPPPPPASQAQTPDPPPQPRRIYLVGGGAQNPAIAQIAGEVLGGAEGVWRLDVGGNACALGGAYRAVWTVEREDESFEAFVGARWREGDFVKRIAEGYRGGGFGRYGRAVEAFGRVEAEVLRRGR